MKSRIFGSIGSIVLENSLFKTMKITKGWFKVWFLPDPKYQICMERHLLGTKNVYEWLLSH